MSAFEGFLHLVNSVCIVLYSWFIFYDNPSLSLHTLIDFEFLLTLDPKGVQIWAAAFTRSIWSTEVLYKFCLCPCTSLLLINICCYLGPELTWQEWVRDTVYIKNPVGDFNNHCYLIIKSYHSHTHLSPEPILKLRCPEMTGQCINTDSSLRDLQKRLLSNLAYELGSGFATLIFYPDKLSFFLSSMGAGMLLR